MPATYGGSGGIVYSTGNPSPSYPANILPGDGIFLLVGTKPDTTPATTPVDFTFLGAFAGGSGNTGIDTGPVRVGVFFKESSGLEGISETVTITGNNVSWAVMVRYSKASNEVWDIALTGGADSTPGSGLWSVLTGTLPAGWLAGGDHALMALCIPTDVVISYPSAGPYNYTCNGGGTVTPGTVSIVATAASSSGQDIGGRVHNQAISSSTMAAGTLTYSFTSTSGTFTNFAGPMALVRIRATAPSQTPISASDTGAISVSDTASISVVTSTSDTSAVSIDESVQNLVSLTRPDAPAVAISEAVVNDVSLSRADTSSLTVTDSASIGTSSVSSDAGSLAITDTAVIAVTTIAADTGSVTITEAVNAAPSTIGSDQGAVSATDIASIFVTFTKSDAGSLIVVDEAVSVVSLSATDSINISIIETVNIFVTSSASDIVGLNVDDHASIVGPTTPKSGNDTSTVSVVDTANVGVLSSLPGLDGGEVGITEVTQIKVMLTAFDSPAVSTIETTQSTIGASVTDTLSTSVIETTQFDIEFIRNDSGALGLQEKGRTGTAQTIIDVSFVAQDTGTLVILDDAFSGDQRNASDDLLIALQDTAQVNVTGTFPKSSEDSSSVSIEDSSSTNVFTPATDPFSFDSKADYDILIGSETTNVSHISTESETVIEIE